MRLNFSVFFDMISLNSIGFVWIFIVPSSEYLWSWSDGHQEVRKIYMFQIIFYNIAMIFYQTARPVWTPEQASCCITNHARLNEIFADVIIKISTRQGHVISLPVPCLNYCRKPRKEKAIWLFPRKFRSLVLLLYKQNKNRFENVSKHSTTVWLVISIRQLY
jgi:hypothetical protein